MSVASAVGVEYLPVLQEECRPKQVYRIDPLGDPRWERFLQAHPRASLFHSSPWLSALRKTYGYEATAYTTSPSDTDLENAILFCKIESWLTGRRIVSLPFSDHCEPLVDSEEDVNMLSAFLEDEVRGKSLDYMEVRPLGTFAPATSLNRTTVTYSVHSLDLRPDLDSLFDHLHKSSTQRKISRAAREGLTYREGSSEDLLDEFYRLFTLTRRRHRLPPQSKAWFANLIEAFGPALKVRVAFKDDRAIAAIITIAHKETLAYKYGACDARFNRLGSMHLLLWRAIQDAKESGLSFLDFGRTDEGQEKLITFKNRWGAVQSSMTYSRYGVSQTATHFFDLSTKKWKARSAKYLLSHLPLIVVSKIGEVLYGHVG